MGDVRKLFEGALSERGIPYLGPDGEGLYELAVDGGSVTVSLDNLARELAQDGDLERVGRFVDAILRGTELPAWPEAAGSLYLSAEPSELELGTALHEPVSPGLRRALALAMMEQGRIAFLEPAQLEDWGVSHEQAETAARANLDALLEGTQLEVEDIDGMKLGMVPVDSPFKASLVFAPGLKAYVASELGWPVLAVAPSRDFLFLFREQDEEMLQRLGGVVQEEYRQAPYPLTTEVLRIGDEGVAAIGKYPE